MFPAHTATLGLFITPITDIQFAYRTIWRRLRAAHRDTLTLLTASVRRGFTAPLPAQLLYYLRSKGLSRREKIPQNDLHSTIPAFVQQTRYGLPYRVLMNIGHIHQSRDIIGAEAWPVMQAPYSMTFIVSKSIRYYRPTAMPFECAENTCQSPLGSTAYTKIDMVNYVFHFDFPCPSFFYRHSSASSMLSSRAIPQTLRCGAA